MTSIGSNAFLSCKNLKKMTIKSAKLKSVGAKAFSGTYSKITFAVPRNTEVWKSFYMSRTIAYFLSQ